MTVKSVEFTYRGNFRTYGTKISTASVAVICRLSPRAANSLLSPLELLQRSLLFYCPQHFLRPDACLHLGNQWKLEMKVTLWYVSLKILVLTDALIWSQVWSTSKFCDPISAFVAHNTRQYLCKMYVSNSHAKLNILYIAYYSWQKSFTFFAQPWKFLVNFAHECYESS